MRLSRRDVLKVAGITAAGIALPTDDAVRRFWPGWRPQRVVLADIDRAIRGLRDYLVPYDLVFVVDDRSSTARGGLAWWTGESFVYPCVGSFSLEPETVLAYGFPVIDASLVRP